MRKVLPAILAFAILILSGCEDESEGISPTCILSTLQIDEYNTLEFRTISGGQIYDVKQIFRDEEEERQLANFGYLYFGDSIAIENRMATRNRELPFIWAILEDDRPKTITRYFGSERVQLVHSFDYSDPSKIRVVLDRIASNGDILNVGYGDYFFDENGNVVRLNTYGLNLDNREELIELVDQELEYDNEINPLKGLILPFFNVTSLPDPRYFSKQNLSRIRDENGDLFYINQYDENSRLQQSVQPNGQTLIFGYLNCD